MSPNRSQPASSPGSGSGQPTRLAGKLVGQLRERIIRWEYPPGHRFTEEDLCLEFGVSRSPVREALKVLVANGFVEQLPRRGYAVRQLDIQEIEELYEVRLALEQLVVERLAGRDQPGDGLDELRRAWSELLKGGAPSSDDLARLDETFHEGLARVLGNSTLVRHLQAINERLLIFRTIDFERPQRAEETCQQHLSVLDRIAAGDREGAREAIRSNIEDGRLIVESAIADALARSYLGQARQTGIRRTG
ncbi:MAG: GntR family transcriptional regulator [Alphaproteobacteria bacterium]|nr:GntR family transcriptional regulator [Alphaproteobacteria bacterium]